MDRKRIQILSLENFWLHCICSESDAEVVKCYFIGYGSDMFRYRFWDDKNKKNLRRVT